MEYYSEPRYSADDLAVGNKRVVDKCLHLHVENIRDLIDAENDSDFDSYLFSKNGMRGTSGNMYKTGRRASGRDLSTKEWFGYDSHQEFINALEYGDDALVQTVEAMKYSIQSELPVAKGRVRRKTRGDFGNELDIHRVYSGDLDRAWSNIRYEDAERRGNNRVTIYVNLSASWSVLAEEAMWRGIAASVLADRYQASGYSVRVIVGANATNGLYTRHDEMEGKYTEISPLDETYREGNASTSVVVKDFNQPTDMNQLVSLTSVGFFRYFLFKSHWMFPGSSPQQNHGTPQESIPSTLADGEGTFIYVGGGVLSREKASNRVHQSIETNEKYQRMS